MRHLAASSRAASGQGEVHARLGPLHQGHIPAQLDADVQAGAHNAFHRQGQVNRDVHALQSHWLPSMQPVQLGNGLLHGAGALTVSGVRAAERLQGRSQSIWRPSQALHYSSVTRCTQPRLNSRAGTLQWTCQCRCGCASAAKLLLRPLRLSNNQASPQSWTTQQGLAPWDDSWKSAVIVSGVWPVT